MTRNDPTGASPQATSCGQLSPERFRELELIAQELFATAHFRRFQCLWLRHVLRLDSSRTAAFLRIHISTVRRICREFALNGTPTVYTREGRGGRRRGDLSFQEEADFISAYARSMDEGMIRNVPAFHREYESRVGRRVNKTTVYRLLERHGWSRLCYRLARPRRKRRASRAAPATQKA